MTTPETTTPIDVKDHLGLAHLACQPYRGAAGRGLDYDDLFQSACEGLTYAAKTYDPSRGAFSTYALPMARKYVKRTVTTGTRTVKCPEYAQDRAARASRPQRAPVAAPRERRTAGGAFDWSAPGARPEAFVPVTRCPPAPTWVDVAIPITRLHAPSDEQSFDSVLYKDDNTTLHDTMADPDQVDPETAIADREQNAHQLEAFWKALRELTPRQAEVITGRLLGRTQASLGRELGVTKARIQQIESEATARLAELVA
jgi:RNA polymerase sigma factor (sigma-70 family)